MTIGAESSCNQSLELSMDVQQWQRLLLSELYDLGMERTAKQLEKEAGIQLRSDGMVRFHHAVNSAEWNEAINIFKNVKVKSDEARRQTQTLLLKCKLLHQINKGDLLEAIATLRNEIKQLEPKPSEEELKDFSILMLCSTRQDLEIFCNNSWDPQPEQVLHRIDQFVDQSESIPKGLLRHLVQQRAQQGSKVTQFPSGNNARTLGDINCLQTIHHHTNDVWDVDFSHDGKYLASTSRDCSIVIWIRESQAGGTFKLFKIISNFASTVYHVSWSPDGKILAACDEENNITLWNAMSGICLRSIDRHEETITAIQWLRCGTRFVSGSADKTVVLWNLNGEALYVWEGQHRILDICLHPLDDVIYLLCNESEIRSLSIHDKTDRLVVETGPISTISLSDDGTLLLLGYTCPRQEIACFDIEQRKMYPRCSGLKQKRFILRPGFVGAQSEFIVSGSEDASIYVWKRSDSELLAIGKGHMSVVNAIKRCPKDPNVFASASDDETVRIWRIT